MKALLYVPVLVWLCTPMVAWAVAVPHLVISEVQIAGATGFSTDEFVELYNPTDSPVDITGWSLVKRTASGAPYPLVTAFESAVVPAHGYFLVAHSTGYTGSVVPDVRYDTTNALAADNSIELVSDLGVVDLVGWGAASVVEGTKAPTPGSAKSIERKALATSTSESMAESGDDMFRGNGEDTDHNDQDWLSRSIPEPQSRISDLEFANAPAPPKPSPAVTTNVNATPTVVIPTVPPPAPASPHHLSLSEILPDPLGPDGDVEFIELQNTGDVAIDLVGWKLNDTSKVGFTFSTGTVPAGAWFVVPRSATGIALNNTGGEAVTLTAPDGVVTSTIAWKGTAPEGQSYAVVNDVWLWTRSLTPGKANVYEDPNRPPVAVIRDLEPTVRVRTVITFSAADSTDPDGDDLEFRWKFSDGKTATGTSVRHAYQKPGKGTATLTVVDAKGKTSTATTTITVQDYDRSTRVALSAVMPNPAEGEEEWVELQSTETRSVDLAGWTLRFGKKVTPLEGVLAAAATRRLGEDDLRFALRNDGGTLELLNAEGAVVNALTYGKVGRGEVVQAGSSAKPEPASKDAENRGAVAGATTARIEAEPAVTPPVSQDLPRWVWLAVAAGAGILWAGYALWHRWRSHAP